MRQQRIWIGFAALAAFECAVAADAQAARSEGTPPVVSAAKATASNEAATSVTGRTAILTGTVDPVGVDTTYSFQYGATSSYGAQTPTRNASAGTVSAVLYGLTPGTVYHYRLVVTNLAGTVRWPPTRRSRRRSRPRPRRSPVPQRSRRGRQRSLEP